MQLQDNVQELKNSITNYVKEMYGTPQNKGEANDMWKQVKSEVNNLVREHLYILEVMHRQNVSKLPNKRRRDESDHNISESESEE